MFVEPVTEALNCTVPLVVVVVLFGVTLTLTTGAVIVQVALALLVGSATLVAFTVLVPAVLGAV